MRFLIIYYNYLKNTRRTILDHLYSFKRYGKDVECHYYNALRGLPKYFVNLPYDGIIIHYTLLGMRNDPNFWQYLMDRFGALGAMKGIKIAIPQDEYTRSRDMCKFFKAYGIKTVFTCAEPSEYQILYPKEESGLEHYFTTLTGYVDDAFLNRIQSLSNEGISRDIDLGYRGNNLPYWVGKHGQLKKEVETQFAKYREKASIKMNITTNAKEVLYGDDLDPLYVALPMHVRVSWGS